jgi:glucose/arabinose dehydrogenase
MSFQGLFRAIVWSWILTILTLNAEAQLQRLANTSLVMPETPPVFGYTSSNAYPKLTFVDPVCIVSPPGETNRLFIVGKTGVIYAITNLASPTESVFMDISNRVTSDISNSASDAEEGLLSMAFDPGYLTNKYFYVFYTGQATNGTVTTSLHHFLSRFSLLAGNTNEGDPNSETPIYIQLKRAPNHNGGDIMFGPDGYLYVSVGDEGNEYDYYTNAQHITWRLWSGILRLDVDKIDPLGLPPNSNSDLGNIFSKTTNYDSPHDNPFVGATTFDGQSINANNVQTEFWAVGLRNPWRMSFDRVTGDLFCGDVGQDQYEEADIITKGGNYGWSWIEGTNSPPSGVTAAILAATPQPLNPINPFVTYAHGSSSIEGDAIMGGVVYRGQNLPQLYGYYVFGDYVDGNVWAIPAAQAIALTATNGTVPPPAPLFTDSSGFSSFGVDPRNGDVLYSSLNNSCIMRIVYNSSSNGASLPPTLYDTGAFTNLFSLTGAQDALLPANGIWPYSVNVPFWSDNAIKSRWFSIPSTHLTIGFNPNGNWSFPTGSVFIKNFNLELTNGSPASEIRLETRFIVVNANGVYGASYIWNSKTNAVLAPAAGFTTNYLINNGGILQTQTWHFPSQTECLTCHTPAGGYALGFRTEQLNGPQDYGFGPINQIQALSNAGYFNTPVTNNPATLLALAASTNIAYSLEFRARSFLAANCSQCHQPNGTAGESLWDARITTPTSQAGLINGVLINNFGNTSNYVIVPLSPAHSVLLTRDSTRDLGHNPSIQMPPLDSYLVDSADTNLLTQWIMSLQPEIVSTAKNGNNFIFSGTYGVPNWPYWVLSSTNVNVPLTNWSLIYTGTFDPYGNFVFTNPMGNNARLFYLLEIP